uniref:(California timema) hypothetical protein n=1 Tax=Timema californicum TaxID=61474 RepID=A0A7R9PF39_TIMCA|nr:unnamed protein product [Timema californicum]
MLSNQTKSLQSTLQTIVYIPDLMSPSPSKGFLTAFTRKSALRFIRKSWIGSLMPLAALIGGICGGPLIEIVGRRTTILGTAIPFILSWLLIALANGVPMIYAGRTVAGFCVGIASLCLPVYLGETVQPEVRGTLGLLPTTLGNVGYLDLQIPTILRRISDIILLDFILAVTYEWV